MTLPGSTITKIEGSAVASSAGTRYPVVIGQGDGTGYTPGNTYIITRSSQLYGATQGGYGPGVDLAAKILKDVQARQNGQGAVVYVPVTGSIAAPAKTYTSASAGPSTRFELSGTPNDDYQFKLQVLEGTDVGGGVTVRYSLDDGLNWTNPQKLTGAGYVTSSISNTGLSLIFSGTVAVGDTFSSWTIPPTLAAVDINAGFTTILANRNYIGGTPMGIFIAGTPLAATSGSALFTAVNSNLTTCEAAALRTGALLQVAPRPTATTSVAKASDAAEVIAEMANVSTSTGNIIVGTCAGGNQIVPSSIPGCGAPWRPHSFSAAGRFASVDVNTNPAYKKLGALGDYVVQNTLAISSPSYDERVDGELYTNSVNKLEAPRTYLEGGGVYLTNDLSHCASTSTYDSWHRGRVVNLAVDLAQFGQDQFTNDVIDTLTDGTGAGDPAVLTIMESQVKAYLDVGLIDPKNRDTGVKKYVSGYEYTIDRTADVLTSKTLYSTLSIVPKGDVKNIVTTVGFERTIGGTSVIR